MNADICTLLGKTLLVSLAGGILCLDRTCLQFMLSRPVVVGPMAGWIFSDVYSGMICGALIELIWIDRLPIGKYVPPNETMTTVIVTASAIAAGQYLGHPSREMTVLALLAFLPLGYAGQKLDTGLIRSNENLARKALNLADKSDMLGIETQHRLAPLKSLILSFLFLFTGVLIGTGLLISVYPAMPSFVRRGLRLIYFFIPLLGIAVALTTIKRRGAIGVFCAVFVALIALWEWTHGFSR